MPLATHVQNGDITITFTSQRHYCWNASARYLPLCPDWRGQRAK
jgi:hypothetical protein